MFTFSTTHVINTNKGNLTGGKNFYLDKDTNTLCIERRGNFKKDLVKEIYKAVGKEAANAKLTIDFSKITSTVGDNLRLDLYLGLSGGSADSRFSNDLAFKGKPLSIDFVWKGTDTVANLKKTLDQYEMLVYGEKLLKATVSGQLLTLEAANEYIRFKKMEILKYTKSTSEYPYIAATEVLKSLDDIEVKTTAADVAAAEGLFKGWEGFGTYSYVLHNLRIPTAYNVGPFAEGADEAPIVGGLYNQYTIRYCVDRGPLGLNAVNDQVTSITTHVFYVLSTLATEFETALKGIGTAKEIAPKTTSSTTGTGD